MEARVDLHVHSKYSDRPSEWILRRIGAPESFVEPLELYRIAKSRGLDFVTISDHNCIDGALEIAHFEDTFISNEVTTYFPEDGCKVHFLVLGIDEEQFRMIEELRPSIYELRDYVVQEDIVHSVAHPFFRVNARLTPLHVEKLLLLFNRFEGLNGSRDRRASDLVNTVFRNLTPEWIDRAAERHRIEPLGPEPWRKTFTGGSDDHSGIYIGGAYTVTPEAATVEEYLEHLRAGRHELAGIAGSSLKLAHSFYEIAYQYYRRRFADSSRYSNDLISDIFENLLGSAQKRKVGMGQRLRGMIGNAIAPRRRYSETERRVISELVELMKENPETGRSEWRRLAETDAERAFHLAGRLTHLLGYSFLQKLGDNAKEGRILDALQNAASLGPVFLGIAPYLASFATQHKDERFLQGIARHFDWANHHEERGGKKVWVTDTFSDINGVARMIQVLGERAHEKGLELEVLTCEEHTVPLPWRTNFTPVGSFAVPEYDTQKVTFPPFLDVIEYLERSKCREIIVSTPGLLGLTAVKAAKLLGIRLAGIYHTDFPAYVLDLTDNEGMADVTESYMSWFYDQMDCIYAPSRAYRQKLIGAGFAPEKLKTLHRGVDVERFRPERRSEGFYRRYSEHDEGIKLIYVGRISAEKNVDYLVDEFLALGEDTPARLYFVGDGPYREALQERVRDLGAQDRVLFTGFLEGEALAVAYASADLFVFPSTTDTFGNVVLEAQASGLPAIVSHEGGPPELIVPGETGLVVDVSEEGELVAALGHLIDEEPVRKSMGIAARRHSLRFGWDQVLEGLWQGLDLAIAPDFEERSAPAGPLAESESDLDVVGALQ